MSGAPRWRVAVDRGVCVGSGLCAAVAPGAFRLDATRRSRPVAEETEASPAVLEAAEGCPVEAVALHVAGTGEAVFPPEE
ncbi:ferredoxin [Streptomyces cinnamoneus]|uniref:Ferredoxin n=1 Tax=Streptomyces cinnamoneus TaxID=53446 RepID=A0A2G1XG71_STRCJ|nr:ferredoxin [Streptomyces cinnamoneus]PHQ50234.1 ferredoxin [Streptomyces cinnamoneus]PPT12981.1 ferredoxin [Streptomyces cinnamoneus]